MVSIFAKSSYLSGQYASSSSNFLQIKTLDQAAPQMDSSSASSEISFHGQPSKSKRHSIRKHSVVVIITVNTIIVLVFTKQPSAERYLANIFSPVFL